MPMSAFRAITILGVLALVPAAANAQSMKSGDMPHAHKHGMSESHAMGAIQTANVWSRATAPSARAGAVFLELTNRGEAPDLLVAAESDVADRVELHTHLMEDGVMKMRKVEAFEVAPGAPTVLQPGGNHIMLLGLRRQLKPGESFPVKLTFRDAGDVEVQVTVGPAGARSHEGGHGGAHSHGSHHGHGGS